MKAYSIDLRERIVAAVENDELSQAEAAEQYEVSVSFIEKLLHRWRTTQDLSARRGRPGPKRVLAPYGDWLRALVREQPDLTLDEIAERVWQAHQVRVNHSMVGRELQLLKLPLKKSRSTPASATRRASKRSARHSVRSWPAKRPNG
jgi:transposase